MAIEATKSESERSPSPSHKRSTSEKIGSSPEREQLRPSNDDTAQFSTGAFRLFGYQGSNMTLDLLLGKP